MFGSRTQTVQATRSTRSTIWSPAQIVAIGVGLASIIFGALALNRTGLHIDDPTGFHNEFSGFHHTPLLGYLEVAFGVLLLLAGVRPVFGRALMTLLGFAAFGLGLVIVADFWPARMHEWLGAHERNGWLFLASGAVLLLATFVLPIFGGTRRVVEQRVVDNDDD